MSDRLEAAIRELAEALREELQAEPVSAAPDRLHSIDEAATLLGLGRTLTYDLISRGELRSVKAGRRRLVPSSSIADFAGR